MIFYQLFLFFIATRVSCSDWVSEWMNPLRNEFRDDSLRKPSKADLKMYQEDPRMDEQKYNLPDEPELAKDITFKANKEEFSTSDLKLKLGKTLQNAKSLAASLKLQIMELMSREDTLKNAIVNGRHGVSVLTVSTMNQAPRSYMIRDSHWTLCNGMIQFPVSAQGIQTNLFNELFKEPRCIGREMPTLVDPCVFNSVIKYEVVPTRRALEYVEEEYLCLKPAFNKTLQRYMSVTKRTVNETCKEGVVRSLAENNIECGIRMLSEYNFYPYRSSSAATLPLEYCTEKDGSCKLIAAWHVSNATIENFEFLRNEQNFKKFFIKSGPYVEHDM